jgi:hypothetical protein
MCAKGVNKRSDYMINSFCSENSFEVSQILSARFLAELLAICDDQL